MSEREQWGSRMGLILAMAGNAVGIGNFLRFPVQATTNGGGAFMIPYFIAFVLLAIPLMWVEWTIGRHGGRYGHGSLPGMFDVMWKHPIAKYLGIFGLFTSTIIMIYYTYLVSWMLGFSFFSLTGEYMGIGDISQMATFLGSYTGASEGHFHSTWPAYIFLLITIVFNFYILSKGLKGGIEKFAKIALPMLFIFAAAIAVWVFTVGTPDPSKPDYSVMNGLAFIWNPDFTQLGDAKIWLAAAGQVFFTLSVGMGTLQAYASYLKAKQDVALSGLATASINEFAEVVLGGTIAIPIAVAFFGIIGTQEIAEGGAFNLGIVSMGVIFQQMGGLGQGLGFMWFFLLFFAGVTSSVAMVQPLISFLKERFEYDHRKATMIIGFIIFITTNLAFFWNKFGFVDEMDYWAGTFMLVIVSLIEIIIFGWLFGIDKGWKELNKGADIKIPIIFKYIIKYVTPAYLITILVVWTAQEALPTLYMEKLTTPTTIASIDYVDEDEMKKYLSENEFNDLKNSLTSTNSSAKLLKLKEDFTGILENEEFAEIKKNTPIQESSKNATLIKARKQLTLIKRKFVKRYIYSKLDQLNQGISSLDSDDFKDDLEYYNNLFDFTIKENASQVFKGLEEQVDKQLQNPLLYKSLLYIKAAELYQDSVNKEKIPYVWLARIFMLLVIVALAFMVRVAWKRKEQDG